MTGDTSSGWTELHYAATRGNQNPGALQTAVAARYDLEAKTSDGQTALHKAVKFGQEQSVRILLQAGSHIEATDGDGQTPLHLSACYNTPASAKALLDSGANREALDRWGWTPVFWAVYRDYDEIFVLLRDAGARTTGVTDDKRMTPLHWTGRAGSPKILRLMLDKCRTMSLEEKDTWGWTPLLWAAYHDKADVLAVLIDFDGNKNVQDPDGRTPLSWAAGEGQAAAVRTLLDKCARRDLKDKDGKTARDWAKTDEIRALFDC